MLRKAGDLEVREAQTFCLTQDIFRQILDLIILLQHMAVVDDILQTLEEPRIDLGQLVDAIDAVTLLQSLGYGEDTQVGRVAQLFIQVLEGQVVVAHETVHALADHTQALLHDLLEAFTDRHDLADRLHAGTNLTAHTHELRQVPTRDLHDHVIDIGRLIGRVWRPHLANLIQAIAQSQLGGHECQRITTGLRRQRGRTAQAGVNLDHAIVAGLRVERVLDVALAHDAQMADRLRRERLQQVKLLLRQRAGRRDHDALARMDAQRVDILHTDDRETMIVLVADHLELDLFPALQRLLDKDLGRIGERALGQRTQLRFVLADAAAHTAQGVSRTDHDRVTNAVGRRDGVVHRLDRLADRCLDLDLAQLLDKQVAIFGVHDRLDRGTQDLYPIFSQSTVIIQLRTTVQGCLPAKCQQDAIRFLFLDDLLHEIGRDRQEIDLVRDTIRCLDRRDVGVDQYRADAFLP